MPDAVQAGALQQARGDRRAIAVLAVDSDRHAIWERRRQLGNPLYWRQRGAWHVALRPLARLAAIYDLDRLAALHRLRDLRHSHGTHLARGAPARRPGAQATLERAENIVEADA